MKKYMADRKEKRRQSWRDAFGEFNAEECLISLCLYSRYYGMGPHWMTLFGSRTKDDALNLLERAVRMRFFLEQKK